MKESEAIEKLKNMRLYMQIEDESNDCKFTEDDYKANEMAIKALEKQIPKKPIMKQYFEDLEDEYLCCPTCGEILTDRIPADNKNFYFYCMNCGQKFDCSDEEWCFNRT